MAVLIMRGYVILLSTRLVVMRGNSNSHRTDRKNQQGQKEEGMETTPSPFALSNKSNNDDCFSLFTIITYDDDFGKKGDRRRSLQRIGQHPLGVSE